MELISSFMSYDCVAFRCQAGCVMPALPNEDRLGPLTQVASAQVAPRKVSTGRLPKAQQEAHRVHILSVAAAEFIKHGFANANVARIAQTAGVSNKTIYSRYPTKEAVLLAVVADIVDTSRSLLVADIAAHSGDPEHVLLVFALRIADEWTSPTDVALYRLIVSESHRFPILARILDQQMEHLRCSLGDYLRDLTTRGVLAIPHIEGAVRQFGMLVYGEVRERALLGEKQSPDAIAEIVRRGVVLFVKGYAMGSAL